MTIDRVLSLVAIIVSFIAVPASGYLSYRFAVKGEKRKEFNAVSDAIRLKLREQKRLIEQGIYPGAHGLTVSESEIDNLIDVSQARFKNSILLSWKKYRDAVTNYGEQNEYGDFQLLNPEQALEKIEKLLNYANKK
jgi:hypothetical protein